MECHVGPKLNIVYPKPGESMRKALNRIAKTKPRGIVLSMLEFLYVNKGKYPALGKSVRVKPVKQIGYQILGVPVYFFMGNEKASEHRIYVIPRKEDMSFGWRICAQCHSKSVNKSAMKHKFQHRKIGIISCPNSYHMSHNITIPSDCPFKMEHFMFASYHGKNK